MTAPRRELWIASGVLVPFAALVVLGLLWTAPPNPPSTFADPPRAPGSSSTPGAPAPTPSQRPSGGGAGAGRGGLALERPPGDVDGGRDEAGSAAPPARYPSGLEAPLRAVESEVSRCLADQGGRAPRRVDVTVDFRPTGAGGFEGVTVRASWQDPYLEACVEDVFAETRWTPTGQETGAPARYTFGLERAP